jgi:hypothetical protein
MVKGVDGWRKSTMKAEYTVGNYGGHGQVIKGVCEMFPNVGVPVLSQAFIVKSIHLSDLPTFMVTPQDGDTVPVPDLQGD